MKKVINRNDTMVEQNIDSTLSDMKAGRNSGVMFLCCTIIVSFILVEIITHLIGITFILGDSMYPTYKNNQLIIYSYDTSSISNGDVVIYNNDNGEQFIKRVIAKGGDTLKIVNTTVYLNGEVLEEKYVVSFTTPYNTEITIPDGYYYVMGDNRDNSIDSRSMGLISQSNIKGVVK